MTAPSRTFVFTGPTLDAAAVRSLLPEAIVLPPIAATDLWPLELQAGDTLAIIDGFFLQRRAIRHKELLEALNKGVTVAGAASMGALRAAELDDFGMVGVGRIYQWYVDGVIDGDDEVALVHGSGDEEYLAHTMALVNVRASLQDAVAAGVCDQLQAKAIVDAVRQMPFTHRERTRMRAHVRTLAGMQEGEVLDVVLDSFVRDLKREDAVALLVAIRDGQLPEPQRAHPVPHVHDTVVEHISLMAQWRVTEEADKHREGGVTPGLILNCARILSLDYPRFHEQVAIAALLADAELECGLIVDEPSDVDRVFVTMLRHRGLLGDGPDAIGVLTDPWLTSSEREAFDESQRLRAFVRRVHTTGWRAEQAVRHLADTGSAEHWRAVAERVERFNAAIRTRRPTFRFEAIPPSVIRSWCTKRWFDGATEVDDTQWWIALADRGLLEQRNFLAAAQRIHPFALLRSDRYDDLATVVPRSGQ